MAIRARYAKIGNRHRIKQAVNRLQKSWQVSKSLQHLNPSDDHLNILMFII